MPWHTHTHAHAEKSVAHTHTHTEQAHAENTKTLLTQEAHAAKKHCSTHFLQKLVFPFLHTHGLPLNHDINLGFSWPQG